VRYAERRPIWEADVARSVYIGEGGAPPGRYRMDLIHLPKGVAVRGYVRPVEDVFFVLEGCITVGWEDAGHIVEESLGPKDVIFNPAGRFHYFRNHGASDAEFMMLVGAAGTEDVRFHSA
jgi:oxalate decarboxylase/phosphoglucose isomerase-like protein (cupin superfamily)